MKKFIIVWFYMFVQCLPAYSHSPMLIKEIEQISSSFVKDIVQGFATEEKLKVAVGTISFQKSGLFGGFSIEIRKVLEEAIDEQLNLSLIKKRGMTIKGHHFIEVSYTTEIVELFFKSPQKDILLTKKVELTQKISTGKLPINYHKIMEFVTALAEDPKTSTQDFTLEMTTNKGQHEGVFVHGEKLILEVRSSITCHLDIFYHLANGQSMQIFPNDYHKDNLIEGGKVYRIPDNSYGFDFEIDTSEIYGAEIIKAIASLREMPVIPGKQIGGGIRGVTVKPKDMMNVYRSNNRTVEAMCTILTVK